MGTLITCQGSRDPMTGLRLTYAQIDEFADAALEAVEVLEDRLESAPDALAVSRA